MKIENCTVEESVGGFTLNNSRDAVLEEAASVDCDEPEDKDDPDAWVQGYLAGVAAVREAIRALKAKPQKT